MALYTPAEAKILTILADGESHPRAEFYHVLLDDCNGDEHNLKVNLSNLIGKLRKKLKPQGMTIMIEHLPNQKSRYRQVRLLKPASAE